MTCTACLVVLRYFNVQMLHNAVINSSDLLSKRWETRGPRNWTVKTALSLLRLPLLAWHNRCTSDLQSLSSAAAPQAQIYTLNWPSAPTAYSGSDGDTAANPSYKPESVHCLSFRSQRQSGSQNTPLIQLQRHQKSDGLRNRESRVRLEPKCLPSCCVRGHDRWC